MNIVVIGCGKIGSTILESLSAEGHDVVAVDNNAAVIEEITNTQDVMGVCGNGVDCDVLEEADVAKAQLVVAATGSDEVNMLVCFMSKKMGAQQTIARIRNPEYDEHSLRFMKKQLDLSMAINPELQVAHELFNMLKTPSAAKIEFFSRRNFELVEILLKPDCPLDGMRLADLPSKYKTRVLICVVRRGDRVFIPDGNFVLQAGDRIGLTALAAEIERFFSAIGLLQRRARNVMLLGGSKTAYYLAKRLIATGTNVKIIEKDEKKCRSLCALLPQAVIIHGDGAAQELLMEEGLEQQDAFVSLTGMDEENILVSIFAASQNVTKVITKISRSELSPMARKLGLDSIVSPQHSISDLLVQYARALENSMGSKVETLYKLMDGNAEALEFTVRENKKLTGRPLKDLTLRPNTLIAGIIRERKTIIPGGEDMILPGDRVVVITADSRLRDLADIIGG